jgi:hypothetical protein
MRACHFFNKQVFLYTGEQHVPHNGQEAKDTLERAQRSGDSITQHFLFPNTHVRFWNQTIRRNEVIRPT